MHPYDIMILISAACMVGFIAIMASRESLPLYLAYVAASVFGTFAGGWLAFHVLPVQKQYALIFGALAGGLVCCILANRAMRGR